MWVTNRQLSYFYEQVKILTALYMETFKTNVGLNIALRLNLIPRNIDPNNIARVCISIRISCFWRQTVQNNGLNPEACNSDIRKICHITTIKCRTGI
jgi:hypothetical protein